MPPAARPNGFKSPSPGEQQELLAALRGGDPGGLIDPARIDVLLRHYECGGWLHARRIAPGAKPLPEPWGQAAARAHRKTVVDSLVALGVGGEVTALLAAAGVRVILLKGASYLGELYDDPGERPLVDLDLLVGPKDVAAVAARLKEAGFAVLETHESPHVAEYRRFEMARPGPAPCRVEVHWQLGTGGRMRFDQAGIRARARRAAIQGVACLALEPHDALLYHVGHAREHYFGPSLKWALDLRAMLDRWRPDPGRLLAGARAAGVRLALHMALRQIDALFPGEAPAGLLAATAPGRLRRFVLDRLRPEGPLEILPWSLGEAPRALLRPLLVDTPGDAWEVSLAVLSRRRSRRRAPPFDRPWEAASNDIAPAAEGAAVD